MPDPEDATSRATQPGDSILLISMRTADLPTAVLTAVFPMGTLEAGAEALCDDCHESVWWSPSTVELVRKQGLPVHVRCNRCVGALGSGGPPEPPTEAQRLEIARATGFAGDALDKMLEDIRRRLFGGPGVAP